MSKKGWNVHDGIEKDIIKIIKEAEMINTNAILKQLREIGHKIHYNPLAKRLKELWEIDSIRFLETQRLWVIK